MRFQRTFVKSAVGGWLGDKFLVRKRRGGLWIWETEGRRRRWSRKRRDWSNFRWWSSRQYRGPYGGRGRGYGSVKSIQKYGFFLSELLPAEQLPKGQMNWVYPSYATSFARFCLVRLCFLDSIPYFNPPFLPVAKAWPRCPT